MKTPTTRMARANALSQLMGHEASQRFGVLEFRREVLGSSLLTQRNAFRFLQTPTPYYLGLDEICDLKIPLLKHVARAEVVNKERLPDKTIEHYRLRTRWHGGKRTTSFKLTHYFPDSRLDTLAVPGQGHGYYVLPLSVFDRLRSISIRLTDHYPWAPRESVWFVLTGRPPFLSPVQVEFPGRHCDDHRYGELVFRIAPWVSEDSVAKCYRHFQQQVFGEKHNRPYSERNLRLAAEVDPHDDRTWQERMSAYNAANPDLMHSESKNFARDYTRTSAALRFPGFDSTFWRTARLEDIREHRKKKR